MEQAKNDDADGGAHHEEALSEDELDLLRGALSLSSKRVEEVTRPLGTPFSLCTSVATSYFCFVR